MLRGTELIHAAISLLIQNNVTCSKTRPGCGHTKLVSALGVTQRDPPPPQSPPLPPLKNPSYAPVKNFTSNVIYCICKIELFIFYCSN